MWKKKKEKKNLLFRVCQPVLLLIAFYETIGNMNKYILNSYILVWSICVVFYET